MRDKERAASTFKIPHSIIALEMGVVRDPADLVEWDGSKHPFPSWERDQSLDSAIKNSVVWFFQRTASLIGRERMLEWLGRLNYGDGKFKGELTQFWLNGDLTISPRQQLDFLRRMFAYELPVSRRSIVIVRSALQMPAGKIQNAAGLFDFPLGWPAGTTVRAKTGSTSVGTERVMWLVGELQTADAKFVFVERLRWTGAPLDAAAAILRAASHLKRFGSQAD